MSRNTVGIRLHLARVLHRGRWWTLSVLLNAAVLAATVLVLSGDSSRGPGGTVTVRTEAARDVELPDEVRPPVEPAVPPPDTSRVEDPVLKDAEPSSDMVAKQEAPISESLGQKGFISDAPFEGPSTNAAIGIGGGAGGAFRGRGGRRNLRAMGGGVRREEPRREGYDALSEEGFHDPRRDPLSTFSIDVDTASYSNVRRILGEGRLPPAGAVRIEEMLNYFSYDYPPPRGDLPFSVVTEIAECPWNPEHRLVHIGVQGRIVPADEIPARNLVFLIDVSGSMNRPDKLPLVTRALRLLVQDLDEDDRVAIAVYAGASGMVLPSTPGSMRSTILSALEQLRAGGSTNGGAGIRLAYSLAREGFVPGGINRVILATDGDFNVGVTSRSELEKLIEKERESGVFLTVLGFGTGNIQDSQIEMLADRGNGNYAYIDTITEARKVLVTEAGGTLVTIAKDVKIQVEFNPARVGGYRLVGYENRKLAARDFNDDTKDAGEIGAGHSVTALYEILSAGDRTGTGDVDPLKYSEATVPGPAAASNELLTLKLRYKQPDGDTSRLLEFPIDDPGNVSLRATSPDFQFAAAVATFGLALRDSEYRGQADFDLAAELAHPTIGEDPYGLRRGFMELCGTAARIRDRN